MKPCGWQARENMKLGGSKWKQVGWKGRDLSSKRGDKARRGDKTQTQQSGACLKIGWEGNSEIKVDIATFTNYFAQPRNLGLRVRTFALESQLQLMPNR